MRKQGAPIEHDEIDRALSPYYKYRPFKIDQFSSNYGTVIKLGALIEYDKAPYFIANIGLLRMIGHLVIMTGR